MYPASELTALAAHKAAHRRDIVRHRGACVTAAGRAAQPLAWVDRMVGHWRRLSPPLRLAAVPLAGLLVHRIPPRASLLGNLIHWAPLAWNLTRGPRVKRSVTPPEPATSVPDFSRPHHAR